MKIQSLTARIFNRSKNAPHAPNKECRDLAKASDVLGLLDLKITRYLGLKRVPIKQIVGSSGRYRDFDLHFAPLSRVDQERWQRIASARRQGKILPPVDLVKVGEIYLVQDGNHRISVAAFLGEEDISARIMEINSDNLQKDESCQRLGFAINKNGCSGQP